MHYDAADFAGAFGHTLAVSGPCAGGVVHHVHDVASGAADYQRVLVHYVQVAEVHRAEGALADRNLAGFEGDEGVDVGILQALHRAVDDRQVVLCAAAAGDDVHHSRFRQGYLGRHVGAGLARSVVDQTLDVHLQQVVAAGGVVFRGVEHYLDSVVLAFAVGLLALEIDGAGGQGLVLGDDGDVPARTAVSFGVVVDYPAAHHIILAYAAFAVEVVKGEVLHLEHAHVERIRLSSGFLGDVEAGRDGASHLVQGGQGDDGAPAFGLHILDCREPEESVHHSYDGLLYPVLPVFIGDRIGNLRCGDGGPEGHGENSAFEAYEHIVLREEELLLAGVFLDKGKFQHPAAGGDGYDGLALFGSVGIVFHGYGSVAFEGSGSGNPGPRRAFPEFGSAFPAADDIESVGSSRGGYRNLRQAAAEFNRFGEFRLLRTGKQAEDKAK